MIIIRFRKCLAFWCVGFFLPALAVSDICFGAQDVVYLQQGWTEPQRQAFYETPQGSYLIPLKWFLSLEQADRGQLFARPANIKRFNYLLNSDSNAPDEDKSVVPLGFAVEPVASGEDWLGYTCSACHTNELVYKGQRVRIDGAPTLADFSGFVTQLQKSVEATMQDEEKFFRFAKRVLGEGAMGQAPNLKEALADYNQTLAGFVNRNQTGSVYGYARLDAFGIIMNEVFGDDLHYPANIKEPNAPVSYPFLWGTPQQDWVQWNGSANNPIGRNVGEVLGTFGGVNLVDPQQLGHSTARGKELIVLENLVAQLKTPQWPEDILGKIDREKAARGKVLYEQFRDNEPSCAYCHALPDANGNYPLTPAEENYFGAQFVETEMTPLGEIGTDSTMALNFAARTVSTAHLAPVLPAPFTGAAELPAPIFLGILVGLATQNTLAAIEPPLTPAQTAAAIGYRIKAPSLPPYTPKSLVAYRARPLNGIWATAPYLHNGSVQNLYQLLLPGERRQSTYYVGSKRFDPEQVGFESNQGPNTSILDASLPGNSNAGHEYGTSLSEQERWDLIEFLKTL